MNSKMKEHQRMSESQSTMLKKNLYFGGIKDQQKKMYKETNLLLSMITECRESRSMAPLILNVGTS